MTLHNRHRRNDSVRRPSRDRWDAVGLIQFGRGRGLLLQRPNRALRVATSIPYRLHDSSSWIYVVPKGASFHPRPPVHCGVSQQPGLQRLRRAITFAQTCVIEWSTYPRVKTLYENPMPGFIIWSKGIVAVAARTVAANQHRACECKKRLPCSVCPANTEIFVPSCSWFHSRFQ